MPLVIVVVAVDEYAGAAYSVTESGGGDGIAEHVATQLATKMSPCASIAKPCAF